MRTRVAAVLVATAMVGCSGGDDTGPGPSSGAVRLETGSAVTLRVGREGGRLRATDASGRVYLLDIPALALRDSLSVTMTPVAGLDLPGGTSLVAAAHFAPEGLQLAVPARLAIVGPGGATGIAAFGYSGDLDSLHLDFIGGRGDTVFVPVRHFSGAGVAATADVALLTPDLGAGAASGAWTDVIELLYAGNAAGQFDVQALASAMRSWADGIVVPALQGAGTDQQLLNAVARYADWRTVVDCGASTAPGCVTFDLYYWTDDVRLDLASQLLPTIADLELELAKALKAGIDRLNATCIANHDIQAADNTLFWDGYAIASGVEGLVPGLDAASFLDAFCVRLKIESVTLPATLAAGTPAQLQVKAGLSFGGGAPDHTEPLFIEVSAGNAGNATPASLSGSTTDGILTMTLTPGGVSPIFLGIHAALTAGHLDQRANVQRDTTYEQPYGHVSLTPTAAILDPGAQAQFTATVTGLGSTAVDWTATGGTRADAGNITTYTAGGVPGTYEVTATSRADPTQKATARIEIVARTAGGVVLTPTSVATVARSHAHLAADCEHLVHSGPGVMTNSQNCESVSATASAHSAAEHTYTLTKDGSGKVTQLHFTGHGSADAAFSEQVSFGTATGGTSYSAYFDVVAPLVAYTITGTLFNSGTGSGGQSDVHLTAAGGPMLHCATTSTQIQNCPTQTSANFSGTLQPGRYYIYIQTRADALAQASGTNTPVSSSAVDVTVTFDQH
jgi:hypothetical protein